MKSRRNRALAGVAVAAVLLLAPEAFTAPAKVPLPKPRPLTTGVVPPGQASRQVLSLRPDATAAPAIPRPASARPPVPLAFAQAPATSVTDLAVVKDAIDFVQASKISQANEAARKIQDPLARKLVEWVILRSDDSEADSTRLITFMTENPSWPSMTMFRRRAEAAIWQERLPAARVKFYFSRNKPISAKGRLAYARALLAEGDKANAVALVRETWRNDPLSKDVEQIALDLFGDHLTVADHKARMDQRFYAEDIDGASRAAARAGANAGLIAKARIAVIKKAKNAKAVLEAVPSALRRDAGYIFSRVQWLRRQDKIAEAAQLLLTAPRDPAETRDPDQWWVERRLIARKLLDAGDASTAYKIARDAAPPERENYRVEHQFTAGWIAFRFLKDPNAALPHFARIVQTAGDNPHALSRSGYWQGRVYETLGRERDARPHYEAAAQHPTTYYGQLARARLGHEEIVLRTPPDPGPERRAAAARLEVVRAAEILYSIDERSLVIPLVADIGERSPDVAALVALGEVAARNQDARAMLLLGKAALARGLPLEQFAFPTIGIPQYKAIGPAVEPSLVYAIARQESTFNQSVVSTANAYGLMQVTHDAGRYIAKRHGATYDRKKLLSDAVYNVQFGAAELGGLMEDFKGSYIMTFVGYNAGRRRVKEWIAAYGDPRDGKTDPVDWVERIPFSETRNYVARVMENLQVYRARFAGSAKLTIEADLRRGNPN